jgi:hypothetical protein
MKKIILFCAAFLLIFTACKKDSGGSGGGSSDALSGTWKFTSVTASTQATGEYNDAGDDIKDVTTSNYTSTDNTGTYVFSGGTATSAGVGYSVSTTLYYTSYDNNVLTDNDSTPYSVTVPSSGGASTYKIIGTDSVYFTGGFVTSADLSGGAQQATTPLGYKFQISGKVLTMTSAIIKDTTEDLGGGLLAQIHDVANFSVTLTKQ